MHSCRIIDVVRRLPMAVRKVCAFLICLCFCWGTSPDVGFSAEEDQTPLVVNHSPFDDSQHEPFQIQWKSEPWFHQVSDVPVNSRNGLMFTGFGDEFQSSHPSGFVLHDKRCSSRRCRKPARFEDDCSGLPGPNSLRRMCGPVENVRPPCPIHESGRLCFFDDVRTLPERWGTDVNSLVTCDNGLFLGTFAVGAAVLRNNVDNQVAQNIQENGPNGGSFSHFLGTSSESFAVQIPLIAGIYAAGLYYQDDDLHELGITMFAAFKFSVISSLALQYATGTHRSDGSTFGSFFDSGFPSTPVATGFALAAVFDERFGWKAGIPAYLTAGLIGWSEVEQGQHKVSDVVFGAALGYVIGKSLGALHYRPDSPCKLVPFVDVSSGTQGIGFERRY